MHHSTYTRDQCVTSPDGIIFATFFGPSFGTSNDVALVVAPSIEQDLRMHVPMYAPRTRYRVYGDAAYSVSDVLTTAFTGPKLTRWQQRFNRSMNGISTAVEWGFGQLVTFMEGINFSPRHKVGETRLGVEFKVAVLMMNCFTCLYRGTIPAATNVMPPRIDTYLR